MYSLPPKSCERGEHRARDGDLPRGAGRPAPLQRGVRRERRGGFFVCF